jgi:hypothetical protein
VDSLSRIPPSFAAALSLALLSACGGTQTVSPSGGTADAGPGLCGETVASCPQDRCEGSHCALVVLANLSGLGLPHVFGVDAEYVYLASERALYRVPRCGGPVETLALSIVPFELAKVAGDSVYFHLSVRAGSVLRMPSAGGASQELNANAADSASTVVAVQPVGGDLYVVDGSELSVIPTGGGVLEPLLDGSGFGELTGDHDYVYFHRTSASGQGLFRTKRGNSAPEALLVTAADSFYVVSPPAVDADFAYLAFGTPPETTLQRVSKNGGEATLVASLEDVPRQLASDGRCVYFALDEKTSSYGYRTLHRIGAAGGRVELLASSALGFALDDTAYYFATASTLFRSPK